MAHFLVVYDRDTGQLIRKRQFEVESDAMHARFLAEHEFAGQSSIEVVALVAESEQDLMVTHGRYFFGLTELADRLG